MRTNVLIGVAAILAVAGCTSSHTSYGPTEFPPLQPAQTAATHETSAAAVDPSMPAPMRAELAALPAAPWSAERLETTSVPDALMTSWRDAENSPTVAQGKCRVQSSAC